MNLASSDCSFLNILEIFQSLLGWIIFVLQKSLCSVPWASKSTSIWLCEMTLLLKKSIMYYEAELCSAQHCLFWEYILLSAHMVAPGCFQSPAVPRILIFLYFHFLFIFIIDFSHLSSLSSSNLKGKSGFFSELQNQATSYIMCLNDWPIHPHKTTVNLNGGFCILICKCISILWPRVPP